VSTKPVPVGIDDTSSDRPVLLQLLLPGNHRSSGISLEGERMLVRRKVLVPDWVTRSLLAALCATVVASLLLGSSSVVAAGSHQVSASTLLRRACEATSTASAFRVQGHITEGGTAMRLDIHFGSAGALITVTEKGDQTVRVIKNGPSVYMEANRSFWLSNTNNNRADASLFAGRWIDMTSDKKDTAGIIKSFSKRAILPSCGGVGSTMYAGKAVVNGVKAYKLEEEGAGNKPDSGYVERGPIPYLLKVSLSPGQSDSGDLVFSDYGVQPDTAAPPGAISISQLSGNSGNS
jgi:hypothetical protein